MGVSTSTDQGCFAGTLGFKACDPATGIPGYVSNNHVAAGDPCENGSVGLEQLHRGTFDAGCVNTTRIGTLNKRVIINFPGPNLVDAAFVKSHDSQTQKAILDIGEPTSTPGTPTLNQCVQKSGRTTGLTFGRIDAVNLTVNVGGYCGGTAQFQQLIRYAPDLTCGPCANLPCSTMSAPGDSGSPVLDLNNNIVGLNFAGNGFQGFGATIQNVLSGLGLTLDLAQCACPATTAVEGTATAESTLNTLHVLRDNVLARNRRGRRYIQLYYQNAEEANSILLTDFGLLLRTQELLDRFMPAIHSVAAERAVTLRQADIEEIDQFLADISVGSSRRMQSAIGEIRRDLQNSATLAQFGVRVTP
jgi:hypothetical protein